jgi:excisionase family DNA binding protein
MTTTDRLLIKPPEAAKLLSIGNRKLWELTNMRAIPCVRIGRAVRYDPNDLRVWVDDQKTAC